MSDKKILTDEEIEYIIKSKYSKKYPNTQNYIREQLKLNSDYKCNFCMIKQDFIDEYYKSVKELKRYPEFDFSSLPEFICSTTKNITLFCTSIGKDGKVIGDYSTCFRDLVIRKHFPKNFDKGIKNPCAYTKEQFIEKARNRFGNLYDYSLVDEDYVDYNTSVRIKCNKCGCVFSMKPIIHAKDGCGCPVCAKEKIRNSKLIGLDNFIKRSIDKFGPDRFGYDKAKYIGSEDEIILYCKTHNKYFKTTPYLHINSEYGGCHDCFYETVHKNNRDVYFENFKEKARLIFGGLYDYSESIYINRSTPILIIDTERNERFWLSPESHLSGVGNPNRSRLKSKGEIIIYSWLCNIKLHNFSWECQKKYLNVYKDHKIFIDFEVLFENRIYWIEYNGIQHYRFDKFIYGDNINKYIHQLNRDESIRVFSSKNDILFVEIPFTYKSKKSIYNILDQIFLEHKDPKNIIKLPKILKL